MNSSSPNAPPPTPEPATSPWSVATPLYVALEICLRCRAPGFYVPQFRRKESGCPTIQSNPTISTEGKWLPKWLPDDPKQTY